MNAEILSRIQFAFTIAFHYIYPPLSIGLGVMLVLMEGMYLKTGKKVYEIMTRFWIKIFALIFGIGVATGIIMEFEFGTNWAVYSKYVGDVFGSALASEGLFAFALESGFLGILIFGWNRVNAKVHFFATIMVAFGAIFSAVWIVIANSWQQTPAGFHIVGDGLHARAEITDFWAMVFNPSSMTRLIHVLIAAFLSGAFLVLSVHAYYIVKNKFIDLATRGFKIALVFATIASLLQLWSGDSSAKKVAAYQPAKLAAFEGHYDSASKADMYVFGITDPKKQTSFGIKFPGGLSFLLYGNFNAPVKGINAFKKEDRPGDHAIKFVFQTYHIMIVCGILMIALSLYGCFLWWRGKLFNRKWVMAIFCFSVFIPQIGNQVGWYSAEVGRQPWLVYGLLKTSEGLTRSLKEGQVLFSLILFTLVYLMLFLLFIYMMNKHIKHGPADEKNNMIPPGSKRNNPIIENS
ncbi:MAG: cytochrome ubiquinol oxidase subunit I [Chitinophagaceae bacterium]|nr:cytochrome ubiquinol oxidase subunit I [Chitinophagaceae bacterium]